MPKLFFATGLWMLIVASIASSQEKSESQKWLEEGEKAWVVATELDQALKAKAAEEELEDDKKKKRGDEKELEKPDFVGAFELFKKAADAGYAKAALRVSELLLDGYGIPKDTVGAFEWSLKAAEMGSLEGQLLTASKYEEGRGPKKSLSSAFALYEKALEQGSPVARMKVAGMLDRGEPGVEKNQARALPLFQQAAKEDGSAAAIYMIGLYLQRGFVVEKDDQAASQWYLRAAEIGEARAQRKLAMRFFRGTGVQQDTVEALKWCELALTNPVGSVATKDLAREYKESFADTVTPRKVEQAMKQVARFKLKTYKDISLPPMPYDGPAPVYHMLTDTNGNELEAAVISLKADAVVLQRRGDGAQFTVPLTRLSAESCKLLEGLEN